MKHSILCVDDEIDNIDALERLFRKKYHVFKASSGIEALTILEQYKNEISVIISDQRMPQMNGVEFLEKSQAIQPDVLRILLTGYTDIDSVISAINSGQIYRYVTKPWDPRELMITIDQAVDRYNVGLELKKKNEVLQKALEDLKVLDNAKNHFMILINHELKTPLTTLTSYIELLNESSLDEIQKKFILRIQESTKKLYLLIENSLKIIAAESGYYPCNMATVDLDSLISSTMDTQLKDIIKSKYLNFEIQLESQFVYGDSKLLSEIFKQIFYNAVKFSPPQSSIVFKSKISKISKNNLNDSYGNYVNSNHNCDCVEICLTNPAPDLKIYQVQNLLKPFVIDEDIMHHSSNNGTGLGLAIVNAFLKRQNSKLNIYIEHGQAIFSFVLLGLDKLNANHTK